MQKTRAGPSLGNSLSPADAVGNQCILIAHQFRTVQASIVFLVTLHSTTLYYRALYCTKMLLFTVCSFIYTSLLDRAKPSLSTQTLEKPTKCHNNNKYLVNYGIKALSSLNITCFITHSILKDLLQKTRFA